MTEQAEVLSAGDARARVAVLEAEVAELRGRACVPEGYVVVPVEPTIDMSAAARRESHVFITFGEAEQVYRSMIAAAPACSGQTYPLYITHRPLIHNAINLLGMRRPVAPDVELVINGLRAMLDGMPTPAEPAAEHWIAVAQSAAPAPVERCDTCYGHGEVPTGETQRFGDLQPPEPVMMVCPECSGHAPVEPVKQAANVFWVLFDNTTDVKYIKKDSDAGTLAFFDNEEDAAWAKRFNPGTDYKRLEYYTTPQPAPTAAQDVAGLVDRIVPRIDAGGPNPINPDVHCCEWTLHKERERIHAEFADALAHQSGGAK